MECVELTRVPLVKPVKSKVVPAGTTRLLRVITGQDFLAFTTAAAPVEPEKVQTALSPRTGATAGAAATREEAESPRVRNVDS